MKSLAKIPAFDSWSASARMTAMSMMWLALTICFFHPASHALDGGLDPSIFTAYAYYISHGLQFGPEAVAMGGPYAFIMYGEFYGGDLFWLRLGCELLTQGIFSAFVLWFLLQQNPRSWTRWLWFLAQLIFSPSIADLTVTWTMVLAGFFLLEKSAPARGLILPALAAALLGLFALVKGPHLVLSFTTVSIVTLAWLLQRNWRQAALIFGSFLIGLLGCWLLARQNPLNLPAYIAGTLHLTESYGSAMSVEEPPAIFHRGAAVAAGFILASGITAWFRRRDFLQFAAIALLAGYSFVMWKHGFVRADGHVVIFFCFMAVAVPTWYLHFVTRKGPTPLGTRMVALTTVALLLLTILAGRPDPLRPSLGLLWSNLWPRLHDHTRYLAHLPTEYAGMEERLQAQRKLQDLPEVRDTIKQDSIDYFGLRQGIILLNEFNYHPRPMAAGSFNVYDRYLMELNRDFLRDPVRQPKFYLLNLETIDHRIVTPDDGLALLQLIYCYRPVLVEQGQLLLQAVPGAIAPTPRLLTHQSVKFGQAVSVPKVGVGEILLTRLDLKPSLRGRVRAALYKPAPVFINLRDSTGTETGSRRLVTSLASSPFILSPFVDDNFSLLNLYDKKAGRALDRFTITTSSQHCFGGEFEIEFYTLPRPTAVEAFALESMQTKMRHNYFNIIPESITPEFKSDRLVRYLHAPSEVVWKLTGKEREIDFHYGFDPRAYKEGTTNGVEFIVEVRGPSGGVQRIFSSMLKPVGNPADRGEHAARVPLPLFAAGSRLVLRTDPGEYGDNAWDWSYATRMEIKQGRYAANMFPNFNRIPDDIDDEHAGLVELDHKKVLMLHVPGVASFNLTGTETHLTFDFGFLPGAYTGEGKTDGADYVIELLRQDQPPQEFFHRRLRPVATEADRGRQSAEVNLPAVNPGDKLVVRIAALKGGSNSWGWTYVERLTIE